MVYKIIKCYGAINSDKFGIYSGCPKSERLVWKSECSVWKTKQNFVRISDVRISDIQAIRLVRSFSYTLNV